MAWSRTGKLAIINGILDTRMYIDILRDHVFESVSNLGIRENF